MNTIRLAAAAALMLTVSYAHASGPSSEAPNTVDWALRLAVGEQQVAYYCTTNCYRIGNSVHCTQSCF